MDSGQKDATAKHHFHNSEKFWSTFFKKVAEYEAEPHFNAKASAFASVLRKYEAMLRIFGMSRAFHKGETVVLIHSLPNRIQKKGEGAKALAEGKYFTPSKQPAGRSLFEAQGRISRSAERDLRNFLKKVP